MKKILNGFLFILSFIWQLPQNIVALIIMPFISKLHLISYKNFCFCYKGDKMGGGISLGNFAFVSPFLSTNEANIAHEQIGHSKQSKILGPLYLFVIGLPSVIHAAISSDCDCYYDFYTEAWANKIADLETVHLPNGQCYVKLK